MDRALSAYVLSTVVACALAAGIFFESSYADEAAGLAPNAATNEITSQADNIASGTWGTCPWEISADGTLAIYPGVGKTNTGQTYDLTFGTAVGEGDWYDYRDSITTVVFAPDKDGVVRAPADSRFLFNGLRNMTRFDASGLDTSGVTNMEGMFSGCSSLTSLDLSSFDTSAVGNMRAMFFYCTSLEALNLSSFDTSCVYDMEGMFADCHELASLDLSSFNTSSVQSMGTSVTGSYIEGAETGMFSSCRSLTALDLSGFDTSNVAHMDYMFNGCMSLKSLDASGFDTSNVWSMEFMFYCCSSLESLNVSSWDVSRVISMAYMFAECSSLARLDLSDWDISLVVTMDGMFEGCCSLMELDISGFSASKAKILRSMFARCSSLTSLDVSGFDTSSAADMSSMFEGCSSLTSLDVSGFDTSEVTDMSFMFSGCSQLAHLDVSNFDTSKVGGYASSHYSANGGFSHMFQACSSLASLDVSGFDTSSSVTMERMFYGCSSLQSLDLSSFDTSHTRILGSMVAGCSSLTSLDVSGFDTSSATDMSSMFKGCSSLISLDVSSFDMSNVCFMDYMFAGCFSLEELAVYALDARDRLVYASNVFDNCTSLTSIDLSRWNVEWANDGSQAVSLSSCTALSCVTIGDGCKARLYLPSGNIDGHSDWYSLDDGSWYSSAEIADSRVGIADTYVKSPTMASSIANATILGYSTQYFQGKPVTFPNLTVKVGRTTLTEGVDYTVGYADNDKPGRATITVAGIGGYEGSKQVHFTIWQKGEDSTDISRKPVTFGVSFPADGSSRTTMEIDWGFDLFDSTSYAYDNRIAIASAVLAESAYSEDLARKVFGELGIGSSSVHSGHGGNWIDEPAFSIGYVRASVGGEEKNVYVVAIRGTEGVWSLDALTDIKSAFNHFEPSANYVRGKLLSFMDRLNELDPSRAGLENVVLVTGHSLGGAVAGRLTEMLGDDPRFKPTSTFCYTFAAPAWRGRLSGADEPHRNIHNVVSDGDCVPNQWYSGACRIGSDIRFVPQQTPGFEGAFAVVTNGRSFANLASRDYIGTGNNAFNVILVNHLMDAYMSYLLCRADADELWTYNFNNVRRVSARCPVDVEIVDECGNVAAKVVNDEEVASDLRVETVIEGDEKYFYLLDDGDYAVSLVGNDQGSMSFSVDDLEIETGRVVSSKEYTGVALAAGKKMEAALSGGAAPNEVRLLVVDSEGKPVAEVREDGAEVSLTEGSLTDPDAPDEFDDVSQYAGAAAKAGFADLAAGAWYMAEGFKDDSGKVVVTYLDYTIGRGLMSGYTGTREGQFGPDDALSRGMAATIIYRMATGATAATTDNAVDAGFADVARGEWYAAAVKWCAEKGVVTGYAGTGRFGPDDGVTREQLAAMVARYCTKVAGMAPAGGDVSRFPDGARIAEWARAAAAFCAANGIITGRSDTGAFDPQGDATRCQMAKIIAVTARMAG